MMNLDIRSLLATYAPGLHAGIPRPLEAPVLEFFERLLRLQEVRHYLHALDGLTNEDFIDEFLELMDFSYSLSMRELERIPPHGRLVVVANHPLGGLDGMVVLRLLRQVRKDVRVLANRLLSHLKPLKEMFLPVDVFASGASRETLRQIHASLEREEAIILFPAGEVSRLRGTRIMDGAWSKSAVSLSRSFDTPVLPIHLDGRNSLFFYALSVVSKAASTLLLPSELFKQKGNSVRIRIGNIIPPRSLKNGTPAEATRVLRRHVLTLGARNQELLPVERPVPKPADRSALKKDLEKCELLGLLNDGKHIYLASGQILPTLMREVGRLREITFRSVHEGTGSRIDNDRFDAWYDHIVLWDDARLEIVGSYRLAACRELTTSWDLSKLYTAQQYTLSYSLRTMLPQAVELGRSFVQRNYWNTNALDLLWQGIAAYLAGRPDIRYFFGTVSLSDTYPDAAKAAIVRYYDKWFGSDKLLAKAHRPYQMPDGLGSMSDELLIGDSPDADMRKLKAFLRENRLSIPPLFRQYVDLCHYGGVKFLAFGKDAEFGDCVDGFIWVDLHDLTDSKKERYFQRNRLLHREKPQSGDFAEIGSEASADSDVALPE